MRCASCKRTSFQFTPLREGRRLWFFWPAAALYFNSRPSARGDSTRYVSSPSQVFQFTPLREGRHFRGRRCASAGYFNSRPSARGDWVANASRHTRMLFQFTPLREGRRAWMGEEALEDLISIHAPPRGATKCCFAMQPKSSAFQFTPLREGRLASSDNCGVLTVFQFTPLREGRRAASHYIRIGAKISIHAPPRGATGDCFRRRPLLLISIHAPPRGATEKGMNKAFDKIFQFTPLREGRPDEKWLITRIMNFNSRPSARGDKVFRITSDSRDIFQFTPLREGRHHARHPHPRSLQISIHAPPRGATAARLPETTAANYFNSRPSARGDGGIGADGRPIRTFQFTPLREGRRDTSDRATRATISIHAPPRGATADVPQLPSERVISIHAPPRGATRVDGGGSTGRPHFNSRPSARGDWNRQCGRTTRRISIHAPPRGATLTSATVSTDRDISIHAPPRGATCPAREKIRR